MHESDFQWALSAHVDERFRKLSFFEQRDDKKATTVSADPGTSDGVRRMLRHPVF